MRFIIDTTNRTIEPKDKNWDFYDWIAKNLRDPMKWTITQTGDGKL